MRNMINKPTVLWRQCKNVGEPPLVFAPEFTLRIYFLKAIGTER